MSETESGETRSDAQRTKVKTVARLVRIVAVVVGLGGLTGAIFGLGIASLIVACIAFIAYLVSDDLFKR